MAIRVLAEATTSAITAGNEVAFTVPRGAFRVGKPNISVQGLDTGETVTFFKWDGSGYQSLENGVYTFGTNGAATFESGGEYGFIKDATAAAIKIVFDDPR